jgi:hypothetical protein
VHAIVSKTHFNAPSKRSEGVSVNASPFVVTAANFELPNWIVLFCSSQEPLERY